MKLIQLIIKDIKNVLYDVKTMGVLILMPIVIMSILGFSLKDMFYQESGEAIEAKKIAIVKMYDYEKDVDEFVKRTENNSQVNVTREEIEDSNIEKILFDEFLDLDEIDAMLDYEIVTASEYESMINNDEIVAAVLLPEKFVYNSLVNFYTEKRNESNIEIITNPKYSISTLYVTGSFEGFASSTNLFNSRIKSLLGKMIKEGLTEQIEMVISMQEEMEPVEVSINQVFKDQKESISSFQYYAAGIMAMFLLYAASFGGKAILSEREEHTLARLSSMGINLNMIVISNFVRIMLLALVQASTMVAFSTFVLGVKWGNLVTVFIGMFAVSAVVAGFGLVMSIMTLSTGKYSIANVFEFVVIQFMALIGGSFIPVEVLPEAISNLNFLSVSGLGIKIFVSGMYDQTVAASASEFIILGVYMVVLIGISTIMLHVIRKKVNVC